MSKEEVKSVVFKNFTDEEFVCSWDAIPYRFPAGKEMYVEDWKADHFAKHLVNKVMNQRKLITTNMVEREPLLRLALPDAGALSAEEAFDVNAREEVKEESKSKKAKKSSEKVEEEFAELKAPKNK